ncbi:response regulator [Paenibacillus chartarius]|uniref:Response regulator n=1 Tax=Paenibacillus chartarius TaxID=747481 RepID=A0ABV6DRT6_9BACL
MRAKVLIVDDEPRICAGLRLTIPWTEMGAEVVGEAYDGEQALQMMEQNGADVIVTDVRMPRMDGLELAERLSSRRFAGKIVMLSGYEEFAYVKKALQFGVKDYLLKPVDADELIGLLRRLIAERNEELQTQTERKLEAVYRYLAGELVEHTEVKDAAKSFDEAGTGTSCRIVLSYIPDYYRFEESHAVGGPNAIRHRWKLTLDDVFRQAGQPAVSLFLQPNRLLTVVTGAGGDLSVVPEQLRSLMDRAAERLRPDIQLSWFEAGGAYTLPELKHAADRLLQTLSARERAMDTEPRPEDYPKELEQRLLEALFQHREQEVRQAAEELFAHFRAHRCSVVDAYEVCSEMYTMLERRLRDMSGLKKLCGQLPKLKTADLTVYDSLAAMEHLFLRALSRTAELLKQAHSGRHRWLIARVRAYIDVHYAEELKSCDIAEMLKVTPNYFSSIFKQETGRTFHEYVNEVRLGKAKKLLAETPELVATVAHSVGYKEYKYFSNLFKKHFGLSPTEFRDRNHS